MLEMLEGTTNEKELQDLPGQLKQCPTRCGPSSAIPSPVQEWCSIPGLLTAYSLSDHSRQSTHVPFQLDGPVLHSEKLHGGFLVARPPALLSLVTSDQRPRRVFERIRQVLPLFLGLPEDLTLLL